MSSREERETLAALFLLPDTIAVEAAYPTKSRLTLQISCTLKSASCPLCQQSSERIHGKYGRTVADVPCAGRLVLEKRGDLWDDPRGFTIAQAHRLTSRSHSRNGRSLAAHSSRSRDSEP